MLRFSCVANGVCLWRRRSLRFARHMTASLIASLLLRCKRRVPVAPSVPSLRSSHDGVAHCFASLALHNGVCLWRRRSLRFARHMTASLIGLQRSTMVLSPESAVRCTFSSLVKFVRLLLVLYLAAFPVIACCAPSVPSLRSSLTASLIASLLLRCKRRVPGTPSVPSLRSSRDDVAHCFASLALQAACACGAVGPFASLVT